LIHVLAIQAQLNLEFSELLSACSGQ